MRAVCCCLRIQPVIQFSFLNALTRTNQRTRFELLIQLGPLIHFLTADYKQAIIRYVADYRRQLLHFLGIGIILRICSTVCFGRLCCPQLFVLQENQRFAAEEGIAVDGCLQSGQVGVLVKNRYFAVSLRRIAKNIFRQRGNNAVAVVILLAAQKQYLRLRQRLMLL